jgi:hypothetical protein
MEATQKEYTPLGDQELNSKNFLSNQRTDAEEQTEGKKLLKDEVNASLNEGENQEGDQDDEEEVAPKRKMRRTGGECPWSKP